eukprot:5758121-Amphidinium_carterae.1
MNAVMCTTLSGDPGRISLKRTTRLVMGYPSRQGRAVVNTPGTSRDHSALGGMLSGQSAAINSNLLGCCASEDRCCDPCGFCCFLFLSRCCCWLGVLFGGLLWSGLLLFEFCGPGSGCAEGEALVGDWVLGFCWRPAWSFFGASRPCASGLVFTTLIPHLFMAAAIICSAFVLSAVRWQSCKRRHVRCSETKMTLNCFCVCAEASPLAQTRQWADTSSLVLCSPSLAPARSSSIVRRSSSSSSLHGSVGEILRERGRGGSQVSPAGWVLPCVGTALACIVVIRVASGTSSPSAGRSSSVKASVSWVANSCAGGYSKCFCAMSGKPS